MLHKHSYQSNLSYAIPCSDIIACSYSSQRPSSVVLESKSTKFFYSQLDLVPRGQSYKTFYTLGGVK